MQNILNYHIYLNESIIHAKGRRYNYEGSRIPKSQLLGSDVTNKISRRQMNDPRITL
jgi:hypothetical protein